MEKSCIFLTIWLFVVLILGQASGLFGPLHASCKIDWTFSDGCDQVNTAITNQIEKWKTDEGCKDGGERCLYSLVSHSATKIEAKHETPAKHYVDDLTFTFTSDGSGCKVHGTSSSEVWYAVLDYGTNYCNLHNLITGCGADKDPGYSENTSDSKCTQYSSADCDKY